MHKHNGKHSLAKEDEESQRTKTGLDILVPKTKDFDRLLRKAAKPTSETSQQDEAKR